MVCSKDIDIIKNNILREPDELYSIFSIDIVSDYWTGEFDLWICEKHRKSKEITYYNPDLLFAYKKV